MSPQIYDSAYDESSKHTQTTFGLFFAILCIVLFLYSLISLVNTTRNLFVSNFILLEEQKISELVIPDKKRKPFQQQDLSKFYTHVQIDTVPFLVSKLREFNLWDIDANSSIPPVIFDNYPEALINRSVKARKKIFFHTLLPSILIVQAEIIQERSILIDILGNLGHNYRGIDFKELNTLQAQLTEDEIEFVSELVGKYRTSQAEKLLEKIDTIPASLILAQGAIESSWGSSRFTREGNNLFGIWTWKDKGIVPYRREDNKTHKVALYPSLIDSIRAYCLTLNRFSAYTKFRTIRQQNRDSFLLSEGLTKYSQKGMVYVNDIKNIIRVNNLQKFDTCFLDKGELSSSQIEDINEIK
jgi:Bax protein